MISNKARFYAGIFLFGSEILGGLIYLSTLMDWSFLTEKLVLIIFVGLAILLYNGLAALLIWNGSEHKDKK